MKVYVIGKSMHADIQVSGDKWYDARAEAIWDAMHRGLSLFGVQIEHTCIVPYGYDNHMWEHLRKRLGDFAHVYVPSVTWGAASFEQRCNPPIPMVAAYRVDALRELDNIDIPFGQLLCGKGYESWTTNKYFYETNGPFVLDEPGSMSTWRKAYGRAVARKLGLQE